MGEHAAPAPGEETWARIATAGYALSAAGYAMNVEDGWARALGVVGYGLLAVAETTGNEKLDVAGRVVLLVFAAVLVARADYVGAVSALGQFLLLTSQVELGGALLVSYYVLRAQEHATKLANGDSLAADSMLLVGQVLLGLTYARKFSQAAEGPPATPKAPEATKRE